MEHYGTMFDFHSYLIYFDAISYFNTSYVIFFKHHQKVDKETIRRKPGIRHRNSLFWMVSWLKPHETQRARPRSKPLCHMLHREKQIKTFPESFMIFMISKRGFAGSPKVQMIQLQGFPHQSVIGLSSLFLAGIFAGSQRPCLKIPNLCLEWKLIMTCHQFHHALDSLSRLQLCNWHSL